jgi:hypothetical protein
MNRLILVDLIAAMLVSGLTQAQGMGGRRESVVVQTDPNLVGWWKLDEVAGTVVGDSSGNGIDGNQFTGYYSGDGVNWIKQPDNENTEANRSPNPQTVNMPPRVYIGLALTSNADEVTTASFSHVAVTGGVSGTWQTASIGVEQPGNSPDDLYVVVEDSAGAAVVMIHPDPAAVNTLAWTEWKIPLGRVRGLNLAKVKRMYIGVGRRDTPMPEGTGRIYIDDIRLVK